MGIETEKDLEEFLKNRSRDYLIGMIKGFWFKSSGNQQENTKC